MDYSTKPRGLVRAPQSFEIPSQSRPHSRQCRQMFLRREVWWLHWHLIIDVRHPQLRSRSCLDTYAARPLRTLFRLRPCFQLPYACYSGSCDSVVRGRHRFGPRPVTLIGTGRHLRRRFCSGIPDSKTVSAPPSGHSVMLQMTGAFRRTMPASKSHEYSKTARAGIGPEKNPALLSAAFRTRPPFGEMHRKTANADCAGGFTGSLAS
jgi:hypothetical protein